MTINAFVVGWPIEHSLSPILHGYWLNQHKIDGTYTRHAIAPENLQEFMGRIRDGEFAGGNITIPHKEQAFGLVDQVDETAKSIAAVNTVWLEGDQLLATNTDAYGFSANLDDFAPEWRDGKVALVYGAGGSARAILWALKQADYRTIYIANRTKTKAENLAEIFGAEFHAVDLDQVDEHLPEVDLVVNTTSLSMNADQEFPIKIKKLKQTALVTDIVYNPLQTNLLKQADKAGLKTVDGIGMLLHQAVPGFVKWFGHTPIVDDGLRRHVLNHLSG